MARRQQQIDVELVAVPDVVVPEMVPETVPEAVKEVAKVTIKNELNQVVNISLTNGHGLVLDPSGSVTVDEEVTRYPHVKDLVKAGVVKLIKQ